jgi:hypothetical protein
MEQKYVWKHLNLKSYMDIPEKKIIVKKSNGGGGVYVPIISCVFPILIIYQIINGAASPAFGFGSI